MLQLTMDIFLQSWFRAEQIDQFFNKTKIISVVGFYLIFCKELESFLAHKPIG